MELLEERSKMDKERTPDDSQDKAETEHEEDQKELYQLAE